MGVLKKRAKNQKNTLNIINLCLRCTKNNFKLLIPVVGIEPTCPQWTLDFESSASANSAIPAYPGDFALISIYEL